MLESELSALLQGNIERCPSPSTSKVKSCPGIKLPKNFYGILLVKQFTKTVPKYSTHGSVGHTCLPSGL